MGLIVDDLRVNVLVGKKNRQAGAVFRPRELLPNPEVPSNTSLLFGLYLHSVSLGYGLPDLPTNLFTLILHTLALVGLDRREESNVGSHLTNQLLIDP